MSGQQTRELIASAESRLIAANAALADLRASLKRATGMLGFRPLTDDEACDPFIPDLVNHGPHPESVERAFSRIARAIGLLGYSGWCGTCPDCRGYLESKFVDAQDALDSALTDMLGVCCPTYGKRSFEARVAQWSHYLLAELWEDLVHYREIAFGIRHDFESLDPAHIRLTEA